MKVRRWVLLLSSVGNLMAGPAMYMYGTFDNCMFDMIVGGAVWIIGIMTFIVWLLYEVRSSKRNLKNRR